MWNGLIVGRGRMATKRFELVMKKERIGKHERAPLMECMVRFREQLKAPFYCPGHKGGRTLGPELGKQMGKFDLNNLPDTDTLHCPSGPIQEAEALIADAYGVDHSFMLVGGSSCGNMAAILSIARPGDEILIQRNAHKSVIAGIIHSEPHLYGFRLRGMNASVWPMDCRSSRSKRPMRSIPRPRG